MESFLVFNLNVGIGTARSAMAAGINPAMTVQDNAYPYSHFTFKIS